MCKLYEVIEQGHLLYYQIPSSVPRYTSVEWLNEESAQGRTCIICTHLRPTCVYSLSLEVYAASQWLCRTVPLYCLAQLPKDLFFTNCSSITLFSYRECCCTFLFSEALFFSLRIPNTQTYCWKYLGGEGMLKPSLGTVATVRNVSDQIKYTDYEA